MNIQVKDKWLNALRSGDYKQEQGKLRSDEGFCCLGVLCDLYIQENELKWEEDIKLIYDDELKEYVKVSSHDKYYFDGESEFLPKSVMEWAELHRNNPYVRVDNSIEYEDNEEGVKWESEDQISDLNDNGYTFDQIAWIIETQL